MKIGVLTLPFNNNYGGYLQCYALMTILKQNGYDVELIYRRHKKAPAIKKIVPTLKNLVKMLLGRNVISIIPDEEKSFRSNGASMMPFLDGRITPKSKPLYTTEEFNKYITGRYDAVIVGSDQVWRPEYGPCIQDFFFCNVKDENVIRISYAASFGTDNPSFAENEIADCGKAIAKFHAVSVREESGINVIKRYGWRLESTPQVVLDPTLLLSKEDYNALLSKTESLSKGKVFCYILDRTKENEEIVNSIKTGKRIDEYMIADIQSSNKDLPSIEDWISAIRDADIVVTDSFHGMVFSVIFNKEFYVCPNIGRGYSRFSSFLGKLGLQDRIVTTVEELGHSNTINWDFVNDKLETLKQSSYSFINNSLR